MKKATRLPQLGSNLSRPVTVELKAHAGKHLVARKSSIVYSELKQLFLARLTDNGLKSVPLMTLRDDLVQMDSSERHLLVATESNIFLSQLGHVSLEFFFDKISKSSSSFFVSSEN